MKCSSSVTTEVENIKVILHLPAHENVNLAAVLPNAWMNAGWFLAVDKQKTRTFGWKGLKNCYRLLIRGCFPQVSKKKNSQQPSLWALLLLHNDDDDDDDLYIYFCNCQASYLKTNKQEFKVTDIPASFTMFNFDQQPEQWITAHLEVFVASR